MLKPSWHDVNSMYKRRDVLITRCTHCKTLIYINCTNIALVLSDTQHNELKCSSDDQMQETAYSSRKPDTSPHHILEKRLHTHSNRDFVHTPVSPPKKAFKMNITHGVPNKMPWYIYLIDNHKYRNKP